VYKLLDFCRSNHIHGVEEDCKRIVNVFIKKKLYENPYLSVSYIFLKFDGSRKMRM